MSERGFAKLKKEGKLEELRQLARKGGKSSSQGQNMQALGRKGGEATKERYGVEFYADIRPHGKKTGQRRAPDLAE